MGPEHSNRDGEGETVKRTALMLAILLAGGGCQGARRPTTGDAGSAEQPAAGTVAIGSEGAIILDSATVARIGLHMAVLERSSRAPELELPAEVVEDPGAGSIVRSGVSGRLTEAGGRAWPRVGESIDAGETIAQVGDARPIVAPRSGTVVALLAQPGELLQAGQELLRLTDFRTALVRVSFEAPEANAPVALEFSTGSGGTRFSGRLQGAAPEADPVTRAPAWLYRVEGRAGLRPGVALLGYRPDPHGAGGGILVPSDAVVQWDALAWAFVERAPGTYVRVRVPTDLAVAGGWLVRQGFSAGDRVVVTGAGQLLSEEFRARITVGQEVGE
jgi:biotin carboxyl carrier protein